MADYFNKAHRPEPKHSNSTDSTSSEDSSSYSSASSEGVTPLPSPTTSKKDTDSLKHIGYFEETCKLEGEIDIEEGVPVSPKPLTISYEEALISVGWQMDNPYILTGYRQALGCVRLCLFSIYGYWHNEAFNILTHLVGSVVFLAILIWQHTLQDYSNQYQVYKQFTQIDSIAMSLYVVSCIICLGMSATFHTLNCHSAKVSHKAHRCDYTGIVVLAVGSILPIIYYSFYGQVKWQVMYSSGILLTGGITAFIVLSQKYRTKRILRTSTFLILGSSALIPIFHTLIVQGYNHAKEMICIDWVFTAGFLYILGAGIYASRFPERLYPGKFDIFFSSHQIFHSLVVLGAICQYVALKGMIVARNDIQTQRLRI